MYTDLYIFSCLLVYQFHDQTNEIHITVIEKSSKTKSVLTQQISVDIGNSSLSTNQCFPEYPSARSTTFAASSLVKPI